MIKQMRVQGWLTEKQNISIAKGDIVDALICNAVFRANAQQSLGDIEEVSMEEKIAEVRKKLQLNEAEIKDEIDELVMEEFYG